MRTCTSDDCRHRNPDYARYCARCGRTILLEVPRPPARRAIARPKDSGFGGILLVILLVWFFSSLLGGLTHVGCAVAPLARAVGGGCG